MVRVTLLCIVLSGCTIQLHPVVQDYGEGPLRIASSHVLVPEDGQTLSADSILSMSLVYDKASDTGNSVQQVKVRVRSSVSAFVHCYYRSGEGRINRILPSGGYKNTYFAAGQTLTVAVDQRLARLPGSSGEEAAFLCLAADEELVDRLPLELAVRDTRTSFHNMSFSKIFYLYRHSTERNLVARSVVWSNSL